MKKIIAILLIACFALPQLAFAGAWTLPRNNVWTEYYMKWEWAKEDYGPDHDKRRYVRDARGWGWSMNPKAEYGVTDWLTLLGGVEYKEGKYKEYARPPGWGPYSVKNHAVTEAQAGARIRLIKEPVVASVQVKGFIYTGYVDDDPNDFRQENPGLSTRCDSLEIRGLVGKKFDTAIPFYVGAESGYRFRNRDVCNDIPFFAEIGFWPLTWLLIKTEVDGYWCHDETGNIESEYAIWRIGPTFQLLDLYAAITGKEMKGLGNDVTRAGRSLDLGVQYGNTFWGRNSAANQEVVLKLSMQF